MRVLLCHNYYRSRAPSGEDIAYDNEKKMLVDAGLIIESYEKFNDDIENIGIIKKVKLGISNSWSNTSYCEIKRKITDPFSKHRPTVLGMTNCDLSNC